LILLYEPALLECDQDFMHDGFGPTEFRSEFGDTAFGTSPREPPKNSISFED
jgi:hypothetical protein